MGKTHKIFNLLSVLVIISMLAVPVLAQPIQGFQYQNETETVSRIETPATTESETKAVVESGNEDEMVADLLPPVKESSAKSKYTFEEAELDATTTNEPAIYIIQLHDPSLVMYKGTIAGLATTNPAMRGEKKLNVESSASVAYMAHLAEEQAKAIADVNEVLGRDIEVTYQYKATLNGFATHLTHREALKVAELSNIKYVERSLEYELHTDRGPGWVGAPGIWGGMPGTLGFPGTMGEGVIVGVIDTGIDPWNPSFVDIGGDGYDHDNPWGAGKYVGVCNPDDPSYDSTFECNDKLIGAWGYDSLGGDPRDFDGHGSHTASTAAGNFVYGATITTPTRVFTADISGVAPHANIIMYAACCTGDALAAARDQVVLDGVDVVNYSIGSSAASSDPWNASYAVQWLAVREAGIFVATSAGNSGPSDATVGSPGDLPWLTTVGANSHNRTFLNSLTVDDSVTGTLTLNGQSMTGELITPTQVVFSSWYTDGGNIDFDDARLCATDVFTPGTFNGEIVVCERGAYGRVAKGETVARGGAGGYILAQPNEFGGGPGALAPDPHVLPAVHIDYYEYQKLLAYMDAATTTVMGTIAGSTLAVDDQYGDIMAAFSSRGPNRSIPLGGIIVPSVTAPGRGIWAAYNIGPTDGEYTFNVIQGTSMSSPHVAGAGALLAALHPEWTASEIESALMLTGRSPVTNDDGFNPTTPFADGAGHIDLGMAATTALLLDVAPGDYAAADPAIGGDPNQINRAALGNNQCLGTCSWNRTFRSVFSHTITWTAYMTASPGLTITVDPPMFTLGLDDTQVVTITADVTALPKDNWVFGGVMFAQTSPFTIPNVHMPLAVVPVSGIIPHKVDFETRRNAGSVLVDGFETLEVTDLTINTYGLVSGTMTTEMLNEDPTNGDPYDNLNDGSVFFVTTTVITGDMVLIAEIIESDAPDIDLFVGMDLDGDGPEASEQLCASTTSSWNEVCELMNPAPGEWWIVVQNWSGSKDQPDLVTLSQAIISGDEGNMTVDGPQTVPAETPYALRLYWDNMMTAGDMWYGLFDLGTDPANPGNIGTIPVRIHRDEDDVMKGVVYEMRGETTMTLTYAITINDNVFPEDLTYWLTDTIPAGLTYVPGSVTGGAMVVDNQLTWTGALSTPVGARGDYVMSDNFSDPSCDTGFGGYVDLEALAGFLPNSSFTGDTVSWTAFSGQNPFQFYGVNNTGMNFTDDGFAFFNSTSGDTPWTNTSLPDPADPNDLLAVFWNDMEIVFDDTPGSARGVTLATAGPEVSIIEYDDMTPYPANDNSNRYDFEIVAHSTIDNTPGAYEFVFAYDNLVTDPGSVVLPGSVTIGTENANGTVASEYLFGNPTGVITNGLMICFDYNGPVFAPTVINYQVTFDSSLACGTTSFINTVDHAVDNLGSKVASTSLEYVKPCSAGVTVTAPTTAITDVAGTDVTYTIWVTNTGDITDTFDLTSYGEGTFSTVGLPITSTTLAPNAGATFDVVFNIPADATEGQQYVTRVTATSQYDNTISDSVDLTTTATLSNLGKPSTVYLPIVFKNYP